MRGLWRQGRKVPINVYEGEGDGARPICQCHTVEDAELIVAAVNFYRPPKPRSINCGEISPLGHICSLESGHRSPHVARDGLGSEVEQWPVYSYRKEKEDQNK